MADPFASLSLNPGAGAPKPQQPSFNANAGGGFGAFGAPAQPQQPSAQGFGQANAADPFSSLAFGGGNSAAP